MVLHSLCNSHCTSYPTTVAPEVPLSLHPRLPSLQGYLPGNFIRMHAAYKETCS